MDYLPHIDWQYFNVRAGLLSAFIVGALRLLEVLFNRHVTRKRQAFDLERERSLVKREEALAASSEQLRKELHEQILDLRTEIDACDDARARQAVQITELTEASKRCAEENSDLQRRVADLQHEMQALKDAL